MITIRPAAERGQTDWGWLDSRHTFSFGEYFDPRNMGFRSLRVINDDRVKPGAGFGTHGHRDMDTRGLAPRYDQRAFDAAAAGKGFVLLASKDGRDGSIPVHQDLALWMTRLRDGEERSHAHAAGRHAWLHVARGRVTLSDHALEEGDGAALSDEAGVRLVGRGEAEVLLFDLA